MFVHANNDRSSAYLEELAADVLEGRVPMARGHAILSTCSGRRVAGNGGQATQNQL